MKWLELYKWVAEVEQLTGGHVEIRTHGGLLDVSVNWCNGDRRFCHREAFTPVELMDANSACIKVRLDFVTRQIGRYVEATK